MASGPRPCYGLFLLRTTSLTPVPQRKRQARRLFYKGRDRSDACSTKEETGPTPVPQRKRQARRLFQRKKRKDRKRSQKRIEEKSKILPFLREVLDMPKVGSSQRD